MSVPVTMQMPNDFIASAGLGGEEGGEDSREQLGALLMDGEQVVIATGGKSGGALFTDRRIIISDQAGVFTKRAVVHFIRAKAIDGATIDAASPLVLRLVGRGFGGANLSFEGEIDPAKLARWCADAMASAT